MGSLKNKVLLPKHGAIWAILHLPFLLDHFLGLLFPHGSCALSLHVSAKRHNTSIRGSYRAPPQIVPRRRTISVTCGNANPPGWKLPFLAPKLQFSPKRCRNHLPVNVKPTQNRKIHLYNSAVSGKKIQFCSSYLAML